MWKPLRRSSFRFLSLFFFPQLCDGPATFYWETHFQTPLNCLGFPSQQSCQLDWARQRRKRKQREFRRGARWRMTSKMTKKKRSKWPSKCFFISTPFIKSWSSSILFFSDNWNRWCCCLASLVLFPFFFQCILVSDWTDVAGLCLVFVIIYRTGGLGK